jgi:hypothetical protein
MADFRAVDRRKGKAGTNGGLQCRHSHAEGGSACCATKKKNIDKYLVILFIISIFA